MLHLFEQECRHFSEAAILYYLTDKSKAAGKVTVVAKKRVRSYFIKYTDLKFNLINTLLKENSIYI